MATHQLSLSECNTPWWYETPSLASQSTFSSNTFCTGTSQIDPFDITPSQSSGYYDEDTTASEASSNMFTAGTGSCATGSEWSGADGAPTRVTNKYTRPDHRRAMEASSQEGGGSVCERCGNHGARTRVHHGESVDGAFDTQTRAKMADHSEAMVASASLTADTTLPLSGSLEISEVGPTPSTCTQELNGQGESQDVSDQHNNIIYKSEYSESSMFSEADYQESQLSHSMASTNQQILRELARDLMQHIDSMKLLPHLQCNSLLGSDDMDYICSPRRTENERRRRIIVSAPCDPDAFDRFVDCLSMERSHSGHAYLAKRIREAIKRKRENPFKTMSSLRNKNSSAGRHHSESDTHSVKKQTNEIQDQHSSSTQSSPGYQCKIDGEVDSHSGRSPSMSSKSPDHPDNRQFSATYQDPTLSPQVPPQPSRSSIGHGPNNSYSTSADSAPSSVFSPRHPSPAVSGSTTPVGGQPYYSRRSPSGSPNLTGYVYTHRVSRHPANQEDPTLTEERYPMSVYDTHKKDRYDNYNQPGGYSSLPRQFSNSIASALSRGSPAYSSARYEMEQKRKPRSINRHGSFHAHNDVNAQLVSPLTRRSPPTDVTVSTQQRANPPFDYNQLRKYSLPVTSQQNTRFTSSGKSHSGSQLGNVHSSQYPPLPEDGRGRIPDRTTTQGDYLLSDTSVMEYGFPTFYSQWAPSENQYATKHHTSLHDSSTHHYQSISPSLSNSRSRHPSLQQDPHLMRDESVHATSDMPGSIDKLSLQGHHLPERAHRRSHSCDASEAQWEGIVPLTHDQMKSRHQSLIRRQRPAYENIVQETLMGKETGDAKLIRRKMLWLQEKVQFTEFVEELNFLTLTHYHQQRNILYSGTLYEHGKPRFLVLLTDMLLILKPRKKIKMNMVQSKLGVQLPQLDWFSDLGCKTKRPLFLHLTMVQRKLKKYSSECFSIRYNNQSEMVEVTLQAVSKEAKEIWVETLSHAIKTCTEDHANSILPVGSPMFTRKSSGQMHSKLSLTVLQANNLALASSNCKTRNHYCSMELASVKCRTPSVKAKCWPSWNFQCIFFNIPVIETVHVGFHAERTTCPDDFLGNVEIDLTTLVHSQRRQEQEMSNDMRKILFKNQAYPLMNGKGTITFDIELDWKNKM